MTDDPYTYKKYRCEWQVLHGEIDQYGMNFKPYEVHSFPTREEAIAYRALPTVAEYNLFNLTWMPVDAPHGYCRTDVSYKEVEVK